MAVSVRCYRIAITPYTDPARGWERSGAPRPFTTAISGITLKFLAIIPPPGRLYENTGYRAIQTDTSISPITKSPGEKSLRDADDAEERQHPDRGTCIVSPLRLRRDDAREAGCSKATLYGHFGQKGSLPSRHLDRMRYAPFRDWRSPRRGSPDRRKVSEDRSDFASILRPPRRSRRAPHRSR